MGFDSEDGCGERAILSKLANYSKPLMAPDGKSVIFTNRREPRIYAVNWDGSNLRPVTDGFALAVWEDLSNSNSWVYVGEPGPNSMTMRRVRRHLLSRPSISDEVWDKTPVDIDNFQLSADGRCAASQFPWPDCGILDLSAGVAHKFGSGCWPSLAPDNNYYLWIFDGAHRNLAFFDPLTARRWVVNINHAPGIGGFEVYHPRWSNDPRFMTMTGPYTVGDNANRIRGGGGAVEIYLGRFSADFRKVEQWVRVTCNTNADFFPDAWVVRPKTGIRAAVQPPRPRVVAESRPASARFVLKARPVELSRIPTPAAIAPYREALVVNRYVVEQVIEGQYDQPQVMTAHWAIRDGRVLPAAARDTNISYRLTIEPFDEHPELEGRRLIMDSDDFSLPLYYEVESAILNKTTTDGHR
jgi:hypothetical protein